MILLKFGKKYASSRQEGSLLRNPLAIGAIKMIQTDLVESYKGDMEKFFKCCYYDLEVDF